MTSVPNPKIRVTGMVLIVLTICAYAGAFVGLGADGTGTRIALGVIGTMLLVPGLLLLRSRTPALAAVGLDARGLVVSVAGEPADVVPWASMHAFGLRRIGPNELGEKAGLRPGGLIVGVTCRSIDVPTRLRPFTASSTDGRTRLVFGLTRTQALALRRQLPAYAEQVAALR